MRKGMRVAKMTKRAGQPAPTGRVVEVRPDSCEVLWDDGHRSIIDRGALTAVKPATRPR